MVIDGAASNILNSYGRVPLERSDFTTFSPDETRSAIRFGRYEFKYVVDNATRVALEEAIVPYMELDLYCARNEDRSYRITSVYFDDRKLSCYHATINGMLNRRKFRLRRYDGGTLSFLEEKGRRNAFAYKVRQPLDRTLYRYVAAADWRALLNAEADAAGKPMAEFLAAGLRNALQPKLRVHYRRRAYVGRGGYRFRITFDDMIRGDASTDLNGSAPFGRDALPARSIVEIKFEYQVPLRFIRQIEILQLRRQSVSKYCICAEAIGLVAMDEGNPMFPR